MTALLAWFPTTQDTFFAVNGTSLNRVPQTQTKLTREIEAICYYRAEPSRPQTSPTQDGLEPLSLHIVGQGLQGHTGQSSVSEDHTTASAAALRYKPYANKPAAAKNGPAADHSSPSAQADPRWGLPPPSLARTSSIDVQASSVRARPPRSRNERGLWFSSRR